MNARRRFVLRIRDGRWLAALGFVLILCLFGCRPIAGDPGSNYDDQPQPAHSTTVGPQPTGPSPSASIIPQAAAPSVPADSTGFCHDGTYTTLHSRQGKAEQCDGHGGVAEG